MSRRAGSRSTSCAPDPMAAALMMGSAVFLMIGTFDALWAIVLDDLEASEWVANIGITLVRPAA